ncbi:MAG: nickel-responsive transcriptional regulator NikR [Gammaproteobacteria bacterium]
MSQTVCFAVSLDEKLLAQFDQALGEQRYATRSEAVRDLIRDHLVQDAWDEKEETIGTITLVYDHHVRALSKKLTDIQHQYHPLILSTMHLHIDPDHCLEVIAVQGRGRDIRAVSDGLISVKGVQHGRLTATTAGSEFS